MSTPRPQESWYDKSVEQVEKRFSTERGKGLSSAEASAARREYGSNNIYKTTSSVSASKLIPTDFTSVLLIAVVLIARIFDVPISASATNGMLLINYGVTLFT